ncbi:hypothetical protein COT62_01050 [Candidatus Roizmanbacteria bacterium CG09_land_8_20_14_0_10_41_9]|uniref:Uncharacterized protein n=1 Tax=Candidatus Roizmanbacteria bacterium CG09_land_8_20_14_0_10_41_9 TaxID=1974850 RepID=A0A2H0WTJ2_9BACT|nr:MAG: hypothetical protein COT62_01050 [Candidatus Roizmanbacteria bacterium CG09_land_8_20_14_0_10_41_9]
MDQKSLEIIYLGFLLPSLFALTLVAEGIYKISKHEEGFFTFALGTLFLLGLGLAYFFLLK